MTKFSLMSKSHAQQLTFGFWKKQKPPCVCPHCQKYTLLANAAK